MQDQKFICNKCGFDSLEGGYCPQCEVGYMLKVCECGTGKYAFECCEIDLDQQQKEAEMKQELAKETEVEIKHIEKMETMEEEAEEQFLKKAAEEAPKTE